MTTRFMVFLKLLCTDSEKGYGYWVCKWPVC